MKKRLLFIIAVVIAVTASVAAYYTVRGAEVAPVLTTARVSRGDIVESVDATGTLEAVTTVQVGTQVSGTIKSLYADFNTRVKKGQVVAELEPSLLQAQADQARASVERLEAEVDRVRVQVEDAQAKLMRAQELSKQQLISRSELETAGTTAREIEASLKSARAQVTQARASLNQNNVTLDHAVIRAPIDGIVISRNVDVGQTVAASTSAPTLFVIAKDLTQMRVNASVDEADIGRIKEGQAVTFRVDAYPDDTFTGTVSQVRLQPVTESNVVSYVTVIDVANLDLKLKPGMTANVTIEMARADDVLKVPASSLRFQPTAEVFAGLKQDLPRETARGARVWVLADNAIHPVAVKAGLSDGANVAILDGELADGAQVVTSVVATSAAATATTGSSPLVPRMPGGRATGGGAQGNQRQGSAGGRQ
ncbi:MAG: efflux RND transporter periplasmic adaptor subunit [Vicinamibacterales bacterium]